MLAWYLEKNVQVLPGGASAASGTGGTSQGEWLTALVVWLFEGLRLPWPMSAILSVFSAGVLGALLAWLYHRLVYNEWSSPEAIALIACLGANAILVGAVMGDHGAIPLMLACAAVIPERAGSRISVGDAQAKMSFGLVLPFLFLAGPGDRVADPGARRVGRRIGSCSPTRRARLPRDVPGSGDADASGDCGHGSPAMLGAGNALQLFDEIYVRAFRPHLLAWNDARLVLGLCGLTIAPAVLVIVAYCLVEDRRRRPWSAVAILVLPFYLVAGTVLFSWPIAFWGCRPPCLLGTFAAWLSVARISPTPRWASVAPIFLEAVISWSPQMLTGGAVLRLHPRLNAHAIYVAPASAHPAPSSPHMVADGFAQPATGRPDDPRASSRREVSPCRCLAGRGPSPIQTEPLTPRTSRPRLVLDSSGDDSDGM